MERVHDSRLAVFSWLVALAVLLSSPLTALGAEKAKFGFSWVLNPQTIQYYASREKGFWKEEGLDVEILRGHGSGDSVKLVGLGTVDIGDSDAGTLVIARAKGANVKEVFMRSMKTMHALLTLKSSGLSTPRDLVGRTIASSPGASTKVIFPAFAEANGFKDSDVKWVQVESAAVIPSVMAGRVDAGVFYTIDVPMLTIMARKAGKEIVSINFADFGLEMYGNGIIASDKVIAERPDFVRKFVRGIARGIDYSVRDPDEATKLYLKIHPENDPEGARGALGVHIDHFLTDEAKKYGYGWMTKETITSTRDLMVRFYGIKEVMPVEDLYTNQFNPKIMPPKN